MAPLSSSCLTIFQSEQTDATCLEEQIQSQKLPKAPLFYKRQSRSMVALACLRCLRLGEAKEMDRR